MGRGFIALVCLAAMSPLNFAQTLDKAKLRQSIEMPAISASFGVQFKSSERDGKGNKFDPKQKIADLQRKLTGGPEDGEIYLEQRAVYLECLKDEKSAKELILKAEATLRPHLLTTDPKLGNLPCLYASILESMHDNPWSDCEKWARRGVSVSPQDWRTWAYLAHARHQQIPSILVGGDEKRLPKERRTQEILGLLITQRALATHVNEAEKALDEAAQHHNKAKELAPNDPKRQAQRYGFRLTEIVLRNAIAVNRGQKAPYPMMQLDRVLLDELQETARLHPDHLLWQSQLVHQLSVLAWRENPDKDIKNAKQFRPARPEDLAAIREAMGRIEKLADEARGESAAYCHSMLAALYASLQDNAAVERHARKILEIDAKHQIASEQLQQALYLQERKSDQLQSAQVLAQNIPTSRNNFLLAKALFLNQRPDLAEQACLGGLKQDAADVHCLLGLAALMMRKGDDAQSLQVVRDLLDRAKRECRPEAGPNLFAEIDYLTAIHQALIGEVGIAHLKLEHLRDENPDNQRYKNAMSAFGK